ncbi:MAG: glutathione peroxidase, partial [Stenotrophobium sp.]
AGTHPLYQYLKREAGGVLGSEGIKWNFTKFLVDKSGKVVKRYGSIDKPESIDKDIAKLL